MSMIRHYFLLLVTMVNLSMLLGVSNGWAAEEVHLHIRNHQFEPERLQVPTGKKIRLIVHNDDPTPEEFESNSLKREKIIKGNSKATIFIGPLAAGEYDFFGEFHMDTAKGLLIAVDE